MSRKQMLRTMIALTLAAAMAVLPAVAAGCPVCVDYNLGANGVSADLTSEKVNSDAKPTQVPEVQPLNGLRFLGWSLQDPAKLSAGRTPELVDPAKTRVTQDTTFYAVYGSADAHETGIHTRYIVGYPNGNFGPGDNITRGSVATIIARAALPGFMEGGDYGTGGYSDVEGHWAQSAIAYCTRFGVFNGFPDGTFRPGQAITRQEFATVMARLDGVLEEGYMPFTDISDAGRWARAGIYTAYTKGWVNGYPDGSFKPLNNIRRDEAVKIFNAYLHRGVNAEGLADLTANTAGTGSEGTTYRVWPDVPKTQWAYYEILEASNDHEFYYVGGEGDAVPEHWTKSWLSGVPAGYQPQ